MISSYIRLLRPHNWVKNLFLFCPLFFSLQITNIHLFSQVIMALVLFSMAASAIYIINDWNDYTEDRLHPIKKMRPIASGAVSIKNALILCGVLLLLSLGGSWLMGMNFFMVVIVYIVMNVLYSLWLKHVGLIDVFIITLGFILRLIAGAVVIQNNLSMWIILLTFLLALFLALAKRLDDVLLATKGIQTRKNIQGYNVEFLHTTLAITAAIIIVCYIFYCISPEVELRFHTQNLYYTVIFVILGVLRFLQIILVEKKSSEPTHILLSDRFLQAVLLAWVTLFCVLVYF